MRPLGAIIPLNGPADAQPNPATTTPDPVVVQAQGGDWQAFNALMRRHERQVLGTARRLVATREDAQDVAQEVFLRLYRFLPRIDPSRPLAAWLYRVTVNVCRDAETRRQRRPTQSLDDATGPVSEPVDPRADTSAVAELAEQRRVLEAALTTLTTKERQAIVLRDIEGLSTAEVASILETQEVTVRSHISRGRLKIHRFREKHLGSSPARQGNPS